MKHQRIILSLFFLYAAVIILSCSAQKQLERKIDKAKVTAYQNPASFADVFATLYPVKDSVATPTVTYTKADNEDLTPTINALVSAVNAAASDSLKLQGEHIKALQFKLTALQRSYVKCKPDTVKLETVVYRENTARLTALKQKHDTLAVTLAKVSQERDSHKITIKEQHDKITHLTTILVLMSAVIFGLTFFAFRRK